MNNPSPDESAVDSRRCDAIVFDLDGVLAHTESLKLAAYQHAFHELHGLTPSEGDGAWHGQDEPEVACHLARQVGLSEPDIPRIIAAKRRRYLEILAEQGSALDPAAPALLAELTRRGVPYALATGSSRRQAETVLGPLAAGFTALVTRDDVCHGKPHPETYALAVERLGVIPSRALALEDTPSGLASARAAGLRCCALAAGSHAEFFPGAERHFDSLTSFQRWLLGSG